MDDLNTIIARNIRRLRQRAGLTQEQMAQVMGHGRPMQCKLESGERVWTPARIARAALHLGVSVPHLVVSTAPPAGESGALQEGEAA